MLALMYPRVCARQRRARSFEIASSGCCRRIFWPPVCVMVHIRSACAEQPLAAPTGIRSSHVKSLSMWPDAPALLR